MRRRWGATGLRVCGERTGFGLSTRGRAGSLRVSVVLGFVFAAIVWRRFDAARARTELESLVAAQLEDGFIGHTIFWDTPLNERQRLTYNVLSPDAPMTASIQPPTLAWAWRIAVGDPAAVPPIGRHHDWLPGDRDPDSNRDGAAVDSAAG